MSSPVCRLCQVTVTHSPIVVHNGRVYRLVFLITDPGVDKCGVAAGALPPPFVDMAKDVEPGPYPFHGGQ